MKKGMKEETGRNKRCKSRDVEGSPLQKSETGRTLETCPHDSGAGTMSPATTTTRVDSHLPSEVLGECVK